MIYKQHNYSSVPTYGWPNYSQGPTGLFNVLLLILWLIYKYLLFYILYKFSARQKKKMNKRTASSFGEYKMYACKSVNVQFCVSLKSYYRKILYFVCYDSYFQINSLTPIALICIC